MWAPSVIWRETLERQVDGIGHTSLELGSRCWSRSRKRRRSRRPWKHAGQLWEAVSDSGAQSDLLIRHFPCH